MYKMTLTLTRFQWIAGDYGQLHISTNYMSTSSCCAQKRTQNDKNLNSSFWANSSHTHTHTILKLFSPVMGEMSFFENHFTIALRSKLYPSDVVTGSVMISPKIGHKNAFWACGNDEWKTQNDYYWRRNPGTRSWWWHEHTVTGFKHDCHHQCT